MRGSQIESQAAEAVPSGANSRNPAWDRDETILLLDLYLRHGRASPANTDVRMLSERLRQLARRRERTIVATYRNPQGVAMKLKAMAQRDPVFAASGQKGLRAVRIDGEVWRDFADAPERLAAEVDRLLSEIRPPSASGSAPNTGLADRRTTRSRGPAPSFGPILIDRYDSECVVYVLRFEGPVQILFAPGRVPTGWIVAKLGRSNDVARRLVELSAGLPPGCGLRWTVLETVRFTSAVDAQAAEQALLLSAEQWGWTLGGEFVIAPQETLLAEVRAFAPAPILEDA